MTGERAGTLRSTGTTKYWTEAMLENLRRQNTWYRPAGSLPEALVSPERPHGVNLCGYLRDESGWGAAGRGYARALQTLGVPVALKDLSALSSNRSQDKTLTAFDASHPYDVNLVCVDAGQHFACMHEVGEGFFEGRYNIGAWAWELPRFPEKWYDRLAYYDEFWVTTSFVANMLAPIAPAPVIRIPPVLTACADGNRALGRLRLGVVPDEFVLLFIFDFHSHLARKNPRAVVDAFKAAFNPSEPACLVLKCVNADADRGGFAALQAAASGYPIAIYDGYWSAEEIRDLVAACDAYVSLHRSEGIGVTITDAMACGKPVIATGWSGNMDFMSVSNSFPVQYELVTLRENVGPYRAGETWAEPSVEHAAELMRFLFLHPDEGQARGRRAKEDIERLCSKEAVAELIWDRLEVIAHRHQLPAFRQEMQAYLSDYKELAPRVAETVRTVVPAGATVIVASKGDAALLNLEGRTGCHFPQAEDGTYAGHYPADGDAAIAHLEELRARGGGYLVLPGTAFWWLDHYASFGRHLNARYQRIWADERCRIYDLHGR